MPETETKDDMAPGRASIPEEWERTAKKRARARTSVRMTRRSSIMKSAARGQDMAREGTRRVEKMAVRSFGRMELRC